MEGAEPSSASPLGREAETMPLGASAGPGRESQLARPRGRMYHSAGLPEIVP